MDIAIGIIIGIFAVLALGSVLCAVSKTNLKEDDRDFIREAISIQARRTVRTIISGERIICTLRKNFEVFAYAKWSVAEQAVAAIRDEWNSAGIHGDCEEATNIDYHGWIWADGSTLSIRATDLL